jgi:hypothetical protein
MGFKSIPDKVKDKIRRIAREEGLSHPELVERFGVTDTTIRQILKTDPVKKELIYAD